MTEIAMVHQTNTGTDNEDTQKKSETAVLESYDAPQLTKTTERKLMAKIDLHILPFLCVLYIMAFLDRYVTYDIWIVKSSQLVQNSC